MAPAGLKGLRMRSRSRFEIRIVRVVVDATESSIGRCCGGEAFFGCRRQKKDGAPVVDVEHSLLLGSTRGAREEAVASSLDLLVPEQVGDEKSGLYVDFALRNLTR